MGFSPRRGDTFPRRSAPPCQLSRSSGQKCGNTAPKLSKFRILAKICTSGATRLQYFYEILNVCTRLQVAFKFLVWSLSRDKHPSYKHFPAVGAFSHKFSIFPAAKLLLGSKKVRGCKNGTDLLYHHAKYGKDRGSRAGCKRKKVWCFFFLFFLCHAFELRSLW